MRKEDSPSEKIHKPKTLSSILPQDFKLGESSPVAFRRRQAPKRSNRRTGAQAMMKRQRRILPRFLPRHSPQRVR